MRRLTGPAIITFWSIFSAALVGIVFNPIWPPLVRIGSGLILGSVWLQPFATKKMTRIAVLKYNGLVLAASVALIIFFLGKSNLYVAIFTAAAAMLIFGSMYMYFEREA